MKHLLTGVAAVAALRSQRQSTRSQIAQRQQPGGRRLRRQVARTSRAAPTDCISEVIRMTQSR
jgi:hypothetical protein